MSVPFSARRWGTRLLPKTVKAGRLNRDPGPPSIKRGVDMFSRNEETTVTVTVNLIPYGVFGVRSDVEERVEKALTLNSGEMYSFPSETSKIMPEFLSSNDVQVI